MAWARLCVGGSNNKTDPWSLGPTELVGYQRAEFARASMLRNWLILCQFAIAMPGAASVVVEDGVVVYFLAAAGVALLLLWLQIDSRYRTHRLAGERARRATLVMQGLGKRISADEIFDLKSAFRVTPEVARLHEDGDYFATKAPSGYRRLAEMLEESAFWTETLQAMSAKAMGAFFSVLLAAGVVTILAAVPFADSSAMMVGVRILLAMLVFALSSDVLMAMRAHAQAAREIKDIRTRLRTSGRNGYDEVDVLFLMSEYNAAVEAAPVVVPLAYRLKRETLNRRWSEYLADRATQSALGGERTALDRATA